MGPVRYHVDLSAVPALAAVLLLPQARGPRCCPGQQYGATALGAILQETGTAAAGARSEDVGQSQAVAIASAEAGAARAAAGDTARSAGQGALVLECDRVRVAAGCPLLLPLAGGDERDRLHYRAR
uniref:Putative secreted protein n=1 Tax=Anopheles triannulatus TaxID=58253 RepID=A0A2M4B5A0_9DIPT